MKDTLLLAIDDHSMPLRRCLCYHISKPSVRTEPVMKPRPDDPRAPDRSGALFYGTVLLDEGKFRMWHFAKYDEIAYGEPGYDEQSHVVYAESDDGIHWTRPHLKQVEIKGSLDNNALALPGAKQYGACVIKDDDDPDPQRRYKMVFNSRNPSSAGPAAEQYAKVSQDDMLRNLSGRTFRTATSADGIHWTAREDLPVDEFIEISSFFKHDGQYVVHGHGISGRCSEGGHLGARQGYAWVSPDFDHWITGYANAFLLPENADPSKRSGHGPDFEADQVHIGVGGASLGNVAIGILGRWHEMGWGAGGSTCNFGLLLSNDGMHFREPVKGHTFLSAKDSPVTPTPGKDFATLLCQANGIINVHDETRIYHGRWRNEDSNKHYAEIGLATLPRDRWGALGVYPDAQEGWVWSAPVTLPANCRVMLNADHADCMRVELSDETFNLMPEYSRENSGIVRNRGSLESEVVWPSANLAELGDQPIRIRTTMRRNGDADPRLYVIYLRAG